MGIVITSYLIRICFVIAMLGLTFQADATTSVTSGSNEQNAETVLLGRLFDAKSAKIIEPGVVVINAGRVVCSGHRHDCTWNSSAEVIGFEDHTILPGLIDLHVHARPHYVGAFVPAGVTTVRDANNSLSMIEALRAVPDAPRIFASGPMFDGPTSRLATFGAVRPGESGSDDQTPWIIETPEQGRDAVITLADAGLNWIKLYERLTLEVVEAVVDEASRQGMRTMIDSGLIFNGGLNGVEIDIVHAALAGVDSNEHLSGLALAYQQRGGDPMADEIDEKILLEIADALSSKDLQIVPTMIVIEQFANPDVAGWEDIPGGTMLVQHMQSHWNQMKAVSDQVGGLAQLDLRLVRSILPMLIDRDVILGAGSDVPAAPYVVPGGALHQELEALVRSGLDPATALQAATWNAAHILNVEDLGHLGPGAFADILVVKGNPTNNIQDTRKIEAVWFNGKIVDREAILQGVNAAFTDSLDSNEGEPNPDGSE